MNNSGLMGFLLKFSNWFGKLTYINILWILFSALGLIVIGFFPATFAMFSVIRLLLNNKGETSILSNFWRFYKKDFFKSNLIGGIIVAILLIFYFDINILRQTSNLFFHFLYYPVLVLACIFCVTVLYVIPTYVHFDLKIFKIFINSFTIMALNPLNTLTMISSVLVISFVSAVIPIVIPLFSGSILALFIFIAALRSYKKIEDNQKQNQLKK